MAKDTPRTRPSQFQPKSLSRIGVLIVSGKIMYGSLARVLKAKKKKKPHTQMLQTDHRMLGKHNVVLEKTLRKEYLSHSIQDSNPSPLTWSVKNLLFDARESLECPPDGKLRLDDMARALAFRERSWVILLGDASRRLELINAIHVEPFSFATRRVGEVRRLHPGPSPNSRSSLWPLSHKRRRSSDVDGARADDPVLIFPLSTREVSVPFGLVEGFLALEEHRTRMSQLAQNLEDERAKDYAFGYHAGFLDDKSVRVFPSNRELSESYRLSLRRRRAAARAKEGTSSTLQAPDARPS
ncbi:hypothetical protein QJS10_CPA06g01254 [Acorus calamus]|uniref:Uncharacterized protein n=1 Tax=Acorus calamus TaxID=4465 RepID=A0AAV9ELD8_ACOCL|nr:hypothetical protein QJS10_CPA06g01254 [Acorus calamus]